MDRDNELTSESTDGVEVLYTATSLQAAIRRVLAPGERDRVAIAPYVSSHALTVLASPQGLRLICKLDPRTDADTLRTLRKRGAILEHARALHMKVYHSRAGCVITSANLSRNAMARAPLKEAGAYFSPGRVDIERYIAECRPQAITPADLRALATSNQTVSPSERDPSQSREPVTYAEWFADRQSRELWRMGWWNVPGSGVAQGARDRALQEYGLPPYNYLNIDSKQGQKGDWYLTFRLPRVISVRWLLAQVHVKSQKGDPYHDEEYPFVVCQVWKPEHLEPPFQVDDRLVRALRATVRKFSPDWVEDSVTLQPTAEFLKLLDAQYRALAAKRQAPGRARK